MDRPVLLLDVDGVLSLFGFPAASPPDGHFVSVDGIPHLLSSACAAHVLALCGDFDLVWCTGWEEKADEHLPHVLGLPGGRPHLVFGPALGPARHWKLEAIDAFAGQCRPLAWVDDGLDASCREWAARRAGPTLLVPTDPAVGITAADRDRLKAWASRL
ncbi:MAG TPA: HAD domain-containing protein [Solirubrobacteraceae bacterium]|nr:HAD domain-containing protein [Solirubrobacteraceae bacterium]